MTDNRNHQPPPPDGEEESTSLSETVAEGMDASVVDPPIDRSGSSAAPETAGTDETVEAEETADTAGVPAPPPLVLDLHPTSDGLALLLDGPAPGDDPEPFLDALVAALEKAEVADPPDRENLAVRIGAVAPQDGRLVDVPVAEGVPPVQPVDGRIDWREDFFVTGFVIDEKTGRVDYRQRQDNLAVAEGKLLARVLPPRDGEAGRDVFGKKIGVPRPHKARLRCGPNVREEDRDGVLHLFAEKEGRIRFADALLAVDEIYTIRGNVGLQTGNIKHPGAVVIEGDISSGARVEAKGDIVVRGMVEPADIRSEGGLYVEGGLIGGKDTTIEVEGGVRARFILEADITAGGDVEAMREINHTGIRTRGQVQVPDGRIVGGRISALGGIIVRDAGADGLGETVFVCGVDFRLEQMRSAARASVRKLEQKRLKLVAKGRQLLKVKKLSPVQKQVLDDLRARITGIDAEIKGQEHDLEEAVFHSQQIARPSMKILGSIFPETVLQIGGVRQKVMKRLPGPHFVTVRNGQIAITPL